MQTSTDPAGVQPLDVAVGERILAKTIDRANARVRPAFGEGAALKERMLATSRYQGDSITAPARYRMSGPATGNHWLRLERDVGRLFSAAPLCAVGSLGNGTSEELSLGREAEVRLMVQAVRDPAKHILLYGERGIGKTSLGNTFWRHSNTSNQPFLAARVQVNPHDDFSSLWLRALTEFRSVFRHYSAEICATFDYVSPDIVRREFQKVPRDLGAIMIVDEFDLLRDREARELTANLLKSLHDHAINVTVLLIGVAQNVEELITNHRSLRRVLSPVKLERASTIDLGAILDSRLALTSLEISVEARSEIVTLSCGLPYYVQILGRLATQNAIEHRRMQVVVDDVTAAIENFLADGGQSLSGDYQRAVESCLESNIFRDIILASALTLSDPSGSFDCSEVLKFINVIAPDKDYHHTRVQQRLAEFVSDRRGKILARNHTQGGYRYCFADALMQSFIIMKAIKDGTIDEALRQLLFHSVNVGENKEHPIEAVEADSRPLGMIVPTVTKEAGRAPADISEARQSRSKFSRIAPAATIVVLLMHPGEPGRPPASEAGQGARAETSITDAAGILPVTVEAVTVEAARGKESTHEPEPAVAAVASPSLAAAPVEPAPAPLSLPVPSAPPTMAAAAPRVPPDRPRPAAKESVALMARGDSLLGVGDVASARLFYERASDAGDGRAALRLGATYDPGFLNRVHLSRYADTAQALAWYRRARDLGEGEAELWIQRIAAKSDRR